MHFTHTTLSWRRRALNAVLAVSVASATLAVAPGAALAAYPTFTFTGRGHGHGIGLSQWGAKGFADRGWSGQKIATYYFPGTSILKAAEKTISVNLDPDAGTGTAAYTNSMWRLSPGYSTSQLQVTGSAGTLPLLSDAQAPVRFVASGTGISVQDKSGNVLGSYTGAVTVTPVGGTEPQLTEVYEGTGNYDRGWVRYRGTMVLTASDSKIKLINKVSMSEYLYGVVPRESPSSWNVEALKAQAIVARSYATVGAPAELYCDTRSQAYCGHSHTSQGTLILDEAASSNSAVDATVGEFVAYNGAIVRTYFSDSSGGHTANIEDVWVGSTPQPYYKGVDDPYCVSPGNDPWSAPVSVDGMTLAGKIGRPSGAAASVYVKGLGLNRVDSGFVKTVDVVWSNDKKTSMSGDSFRSALAMKSTKFFTGAPYDRVALGDRYATAVAVSKSLYPEGATASSVVVANGTDEKFPDALTASGLAGISGGPVLLTRADRIGEDVLAEVARLKGQGATRVYIVGGVKSVTPAVEARLASVMGGAGAVERLAGNGRYGTDRYGTAATVALKMKALGADGSKVLIASGEKWTDAAVASSVSAASKRPVVLVAAGRLPEGSRLALIDLGARETAVFGGPATIGNGALKPVLATTRESAPARRFGTTGTRYDVAAAAAQWCVDSFGYTLDSVYISTGDKFPDSVTGGVLAARYKHPLLLTASAGASSATVSYLRANRVAIESLTIVGGTASVPSTVVGVLSGAAD